MQILNIGGIKFGDTQLILPTAVFINIYMANLHTGCLLDFRHFQIIFQMCANSRPVRVGEIGGWWEWGGEWYEQPGRFC